MPKQPGPGFNNSTKLKNIELGKGRLYSPATIRIHFLVALALDFGLGMGTKSPDFFTDSTHQLQF